MISVGLFPVKFEKNRERVVVSVAIQRDDEPINEVGRLSLFEDEFLVLDHMLRSGASVFVDNEGDYLEDKSSTHAFMEGIDEKKTS